MLAGLAALVGLVGLAPGGCDVEPCKDCGGPPATVDFRTFSGLATRPLDILLLADGGDAAATARELIVSELPAALDRLAKTGGLPSIRFAAVTTSGEACTGPPQPVSPPCPVGTGYTFLATGPCGSYAYPNGFGASGPEEVAACLAAAPLSRCTGADLLETLLQTVGDPASVGIAGRVPFFRREAALMVVFVSSGVDAAAATAPLRSPEAILAAIQQLRDGYGDLAVAALEVGDTGLAPATSAGAAPKSRVAAFTDLLGPVGLRGPARPGVLGDMLGWLNRAFDVGTWCVGDLEDTDPDTDGVQASCVVRITRESEGASLDEVLPACASGAAPPCWRLLSSTWCGSMVKVDWPPGFCPQTVLELDTACKI